jgi:hypothetical protein
MSFDCQAQTLEHLGHRKHRPDAHLVGFAAGDREAKEATQRLQPVALMRSASSTTTQAPAPSLNWLALPAVTTPPGCAARIEALMPSYRGARAQALIGADR